MKQIVVQDKLGNKYTLEYTRDTVVLAERSGFSADKGASMPMTSIRQLFYFAFMAHHKNIKESTVDELFMMQRDKEKLVEKLVEMYREPFETLMDDGEEGNAPWEANW